VEVSLTRFRLRFLLQEFDLAGPDVVLGRSPECHVTLEDPLVSRRHARVIIDGESAVIHDLGSRNGVRVNGRRIQEPMRLKDGDRLRLGTQELVFFAVSRDERVARTTGFMRTCRACGTPFPEQARSCPHCGHHSAEDETMSGLKVDMPRRWTFQLLTEVGDRAIDIGNHEQADRILRRAAKEVADRESAGEVLDATQVRILGAFALRLARLGDRPSWVSWALDLHRTHGYFPAHDVIEALVGLDWDAMRPEREALEAFTRWVESSHVASVAAAGEVEKLKGLSARLTSTGTEGPA
jgi:hypothetical protein